MNVWSILDNLKSVLFNHSEKNNLGRRKYKLSIALHLGFGISPSCHFSVCEHFYKNVIIGPWPVWLSGLSTGRPVNQRITGSIPVRAHAWVVGQVPNWRHVTGHHSLMFLSLSFSLPFSKSKSIKSLKKCYHWYTNSVTYAFPFNMVW